LNAGDPNIMKIIGEALICCEYIIREDQESMEHTEDAFLYFCFLRAILGLQTQKIESLIGILKWMKILSSEELVINRPLRISKKRDN
jgi:hypothetical protein